MQKELLEDYSWILAGSQRIKIINVLTKPKTPKMISDETKLKFSNVSDCLKIMKERGLVKILNPSSHLGRLYQLTSKGERIRKEIVQPTEL